MSAAALAKFVDGPKKVRIGSVGERYLFADCAGCGAKEPMIAGAIVVDGSKPVTAENVGIVKRGAGYYHALYCEACFAPMWATGEVKRVQENTPCTGR